MYIVRACLYKFMFAQFIVRYSMYLYVLIAQPLCLWVNVCVIK